MTGQYLRLLLLRLPVVITWECQGIFNTPPVPPPFPPHPPTALIEDGVAVGTLHNAIHVVPYGVILGEGRERERERERERGEEWEHSI